MYKNSKEDILNGELNYSLLSIFSEKLRVGIIGAGVGGFIKAKHFYNQGCYIEVLTKECNSSFDKLCGKNMNIIKKEYYESFLDDKHLIIIAVDDSKIAKKIKDDCEKRYKIYINSTSFIDGMGSVPVQKDLDNIVVGINTRGGNPKGSMMLGNIVASELEKYDNFIGFTTIVRNKVKNIPEIKKSVIGFIATEDFLFFYNKGKGKEVLSMFFDKEGT